MHLGGNIKLLFVYDLLPEHDLFWRDGLWAALKELEKEWEVTYLNIAKEEDWEKKWWDLEGKNDFVLGWGGTGSPHFLKVWANGIGGKGGWCFGGGNINEERLEKFPVVFVENESQLIKPNFRHAFGTNTDLFKTLQQPIIIDALYPAAFAYWKHQEQFAVICEQENLKGLAVGYIQRNNPQESYELVSACVAREVAVMDWVPAESLVWLYNASKEVIITADASGGSERAVLEAKACGVPVRVVSDSEKLHVLNKLSTEEVRTEWNHIKYASKLKEGIREVLSHR